MKVLSIHPNETKMLAALLEKLQLISEDSINQRQVFNIGVSGGSMVKQLAAILPKVKNISSWRFFFCDERIVPFNDEESTYGMYLKTFKKNGINVNAEQFVTINPSLNAPDAANDYTEKLSKFFLNEITPTFDLLLLGMGPDGHTCSLFPGHNLLNELTKPIAFISDSPKPPPNRITMTYTTINNARNVMFIVAGAGKADVIKRIFKDNEKLPASMVDPTKGDVIWFLDSDAASFIK